MKGYTIQHSIDLLEKAVENGGGSGGASTAADVSYDNTTSHLTADDVQEAIDELNTKIGAIDTGIHYSGEEQLVGTWTDGSNLYAKTFTGTSPANDTATPIVDLDDNTATIRNFDGMIGSRKCPSYGGSTSYVECWITTNGYQLGCIAKGSDYQSKPFVIRVLYTKTAPEAQTNTRKKSSKQEEMK